MDGWRRDLKEALKIGLRGWAFVEQCVRVDEGQVLALFFCEGWRCFAGHKIRDLIKDPHEYTLSRDTDSRRAAGTSGPGEWRQGGGSQDQAGSNPARRRCGVQRRSDCRQ